MSPASMVFLLFVAPWVGRFLGLLSHRLLGNAEPIFEPTGRGARDAYKSCMVVIPFVLWPIGRSQCVKRCVKKPIFLPLMEVLAICLAILAMQRGGTVWQIWMTTAVLWLLLALFVCDLVWMRLPDILTFSLFVLCMISAWISAEHVSAFLGALIGAGSFWALRSVYYFLRHREGLGLGDVKLMAGLGALTGPATLPLLVVLAASGGLLVVLVFYRDTRADSILPFGTTLCITAAVLLVFGRTLI